MLTAVLLGHVKRRPIDTRKSRTIPSPARSYLQSPTGASP